MGQALAHLKKFKKSKRLLKSQLEAFDALRDTQVQLTIVEELQEDLPEITPFRNHLRVREKRLTSRLNKTIKDFQSTALARPVARLRKAMLGKPSAEADAAIWSEVDDAFALVIRRRSAVRADDTASIHRLRLAFKDFRYRIESIQPLLTGAPGTLMRRLHDYQTLMGDIQDVEVGLQMLVDYSARSGVELAGVQTRLTEMHQAHVRAFIEAMPEVRAFWRATPEKSFPWQSKKRVTS